MDIIKTLFMGGRPIEEKDIGRSPYVLNAYQKGLKNYRLITNKTIIEQGLIKGKDIPKFAFTFLMENGEVLGVVNPVRTAAPQLILRRLDKKEFCVVGNQGAFFYGQGLLPADFKYGTPLLLVEGVLDRDALLDIYPYTLSVLSASMSTRQKFLLSYMTDKVMLLYDNDKMGLEGIKRDDRIIKQEYKNIQVFPLKHRFGVKDTGTIAEYGFYGKSFEQEDLRNFYRTQINSVLQKAW